MPSQTTPRKPGKTPVERARLSVFISSALVEKVKLLAFEQGGRPSTIVASLLKGVRSIDLAKAPPDDDSAAKEQVIYRIPPDIDKDVREMAFEHKVTLSHIVGLVLHAAPKPKIQRDSL